VPDELSEDDRWWRQGQSNPFERVEPEGGPGPHDAELLSDESADLIPCPQCGKALGAFVTRCHHCEAVFPREVWQLSRRYRHSMGQRIQWLFIALLVAIMVLGGVGLATAVVYLLRLSD